MSVNATQVSEQMDHPVLCFRDLISLKSPSDLIEPDTEKFKPCFVTKPEPEEVSEGQCARFVCRVTGYPKPRVMWLLNGHTVINVSWKINHNRIQYLLVVTK